MHRYSFTDVTNLSPNGVGPFFGTGKDTQEQKVSVRTPFDVCCGHFFNAIGNLAGAITTCVIRADHQHDQLRIGSRSAPPTPMLPADEVIGGIAGCAKPALIAAHHFIGKRRDIHAMNHRPFAGAWGIGAVSGTLSAGIEA
jgi:hypothetical protein